MNIKKIKEIYLKNKQYIRTDILSGITVALALIPEAVAFAFVAGVTPLLSLQGAIIMALVAAIFTGRPGMVSSSTAAIAVVFAPLIADYGLDYLYATVILMGIIQIILHLINLGKYTTIIPHSVVLGFLNGLAILIFISQINQFKSIEIVDGVRITDWLPPLDLGIMVFFVAITMAIVYFFPKFTKAVPATLVAIVTVTIISILLNYFGIYELITVADYAGEVLRGELPKFGIPNVPFTFETLKIIFPFALIGGLVGLTEAALTGEVLDEMTNTKGKMNKEFFAQGIANFVNGLFGGMGGDAMVGQSIINVKSGGRTRFSSFVAGAGLMLMLFFAAPFVNAMPLASLVGVMFMVVISTFRWETLKFKGKIPNQEIFIIIAVTGLTVFIDLATAVVAGIVLSTVIFAWEKGKALDVNIIEEEGQKTYKINGIIFFGSTVQFKELFDPQNDPKNVFLDLKYAKVTDMSAIEIINVVSTKYANLGKKLTITRPNENCKMLLKNAENLTDIYLDENLDPTK